MMAGSAACAFERMDASVVRSVKESFRELCISHGIGTTTNAEKLIIRSRFLSLHNELRQKPWQSLTQLLALSGHNNGDGESPITSPVKKQRVRSNGVDQGDSDAPNALAKAPRAKLKIAKVKAADTDGPRVSGHFCRWRNCAQADVSFATPEEMSAHMEEHTRARDHTAYASTAEANSITDAKKDKRSLISSVAGDILKRDAGAASAEGPLRQGKHADRQFGAGSTTAAVASHPGRPAAVTLVMYGHRLRRTKAKLKRKTPPKPRVVDFDRLWQLAERRKGPPPKRTLKLPYLRRNGGKRGARIWQARTFNKAFGYGADAERVKIAYVGERPQSQQSQVQPLQQGQVPLDGPLSSPSKQGGGKVSTMRTKKRFNLSPYKRKGKPRRRASESEPSLDTQGGDDGGGTYGEVDALDDVAAMGDDDDVNAFETKGSGAIRTHNRRRSDAAECDALPTQPKKKAKVDVSVPAGVELGPDGLPVKRKRGRPKGTRNGEGKGKARDRKAAAAAAASLPLLASAGPPASDVETASALAPQAQAQPQPIPAAARLPKLSRRDMLAKQAALAMEAARAKGGWQPGDDDFEEDDRGRHVDGSGSGSGSGDGTHTQGTEAPETISRFFDARPHQSAHSDFSDDFATFEGEPTSDDSEIHRDASSESNGAREHGEEDQSGGVATAPIATAPVMCASLLDVSVSEAKSADDPVTEAAKGVDQVGGSHVGFPGVLGSMHSPNRVSRIYAQPLRVPTLGALGAFAGLGSGVRGMPNPFGPVRPGQPGAPRGALIVEEA